jgi:eukaryotic-like serine/threonine-protein kinase
VKDKQAIPSVPPRIGRFIVRRELARGGTARVFSAQDPDIGDAAAFAIKMLDASLAHDEAFMRRFEHEGQLALGIEHPNVVRTLELLRLNGTLAVVMEQLRGATARDIMGTRATETTTTGRVLAFRPLPLSAAVSLVRQAAQGLHAVHACRPRGERPVVHRDVGPANLFVTREGAVKVFDFGAATSDLMADLTPAGQQMGTLAYLAPEQLAGQPVDARTDVYALGVTLFELATGQRLFLRGSDRETFQALTAGHIPDPAKLVPGFTDDLRTILKRCLTPVLRKRLPSAGALAQALTPHEHEGAAELARLATSLDGARPAP